MSIDITGNGFAVKRVGRGCCLTLGVREGGDTLPVRSGGHYPVRVASLRTLGKGTLHRRQISACVVAIAVVTAGAVNLAGGGDAFWLCLPAVLLACAWCRTRLGAAVSAATIIGSTATSSVALMHARPLPSPLLVVLVASASVTVLFVVRERLERERDELSGFALSDPLTNIANRRSLLARAEYEIARHTRARLSFAVVMLDLDGFKRLNDRFGHSAGDGLLCDVATALERSMRAQDTVARIGGDEFCVLAPETDKSGTQRLSVRIVQAVGAVTAGVESVRTSIGVAVFPDDGVTAEALLQAADQQLLRSKRERQRGRADRRAA
jgi:diguanylate cyclase (GGDEF)-like protein